MIARIAVLALGLVATAAAAEPSQTLRFYGYAYDLRSGEHLYTEVHRQELAGERWLRGTIRYFDAGGRPMGEKGLDFSRDPYVPEYRFTLPDLGYVEAITSSGDPIRLERRLNGGPVERAALQVDGPMCADSGFHSFIRAHFERLLSGEWLRFRMVVAGSLDQFRFRARRIGDTQFEGRPAVRFRVELDSLLRLLVDPLELTYDPDSLRLLEYRGVSNVRDPATGQPLEVRIAYYSERPDNVAVLPPLEPERSCLQSALSC